MLLPHFGVSNYHEYDLSSEIIAHRCFTRLGISAYSTVFCGFSEACCMVFYREDFRKIFNKENPENKAVSAVSACCGSCFYMLCVYI